MSFAGLLDTLSFKSYQYQVNKVEKSAGSKSGILGIKTQILVVALLFQAIQPAFAFPNHRHIDVHALHHRAIKHKGLDTAFPSEGITVVSTFRPIYYLPTQAPLTTAPPTQTSKNMPTTRFNESRPVTVENPGTVTLSPTSTLSGKPISINETDVHPESVPTQILSANIMDAPIATSAPLGMFSVKTNHPVPRAGVVNMNNVPVGTNKFWGNLVLGNGNQGVFVQPYQVWVNKDANIWGACISHVDPNQLAYGPDPNANPVEYYINPLNMISLSLSAVEFNSYTSSMNTEALTPHSALLTLWADKTKYPNRKRLSIPLVQGMGFVSGRYNSLQPKFDSNILIRSFQYMGPIYGGNGATRYKWRVILEDGKEWRIYAVSNSGTPALNLKLVNNTRIQATGLFSGVVQIAKLPNTALESTLDMTAGSLPTGIVMTAGVSGSTGSYTFNIQTTGVSTSGSCLMYALAHHVASFDAATSARVVSGLQLKATTKGLMTAVVGNSWTLIENALPVGVGFLTGGVTSFSANALAAMRSAATLDIQSDVVTLSNLNSQYFAGKALARYAQIVLVANDILQDVNMTTIGLNKLITAFQRFASNTQQVPLVYDATWGGVCSSSWWLTGDSGADFGNAYYNDHHFHYGYFVYAAAVLVHIETSLKGSSPWLQANKDYINSLVRDVANPSTKDTYFPVSRNFDFWNGHSWATGLYARGDGKDEESSSEDYNFSYGMKLWAQVIGDPNMEARANLQLAILSRSLNSYFLMSSTNTIQPANFIGNKVSGILFENKVDHTTYFGADTYLIQGIHMIPLTPISPYVRQKQFSSEEWATYFQGKTDNINNGWRGILWASVAIWAPSTSWDFFAANTFQSGWLDDGASRTWYLAFAAGLGGSS